MSLERLKLLILVLFAIGFVTFSLKPIVLAKPAFMDRYNRDEFAKEEFKNKCTICHFERGGGERNEFGEAFEDAGYRFTPQFRAKFAKFFNLPKK